MNRVLEIDRNSKFAAHLLREDEYRLLAENILEEGIVLMPIIVWNNIIVDGHNRYKIAMEIHQIPSDKIPQTNFRVKKELALEAL